jgi:hypothetical protein
MAQMREYIDHLDHWHERREDIAYAMQSAEEFIAMLSNENVAKFLSMVQATGDMRVSDERRSLWESIIDQIVKLFKAAKGSLLESALTELIGFSLRDRGKKGVKYSLSEKIDPSRQTEGQVQTQFLAAMQALSMAGGDIEILETGLDKQMGMWDDRAIQLVIPDLANPTTETFRLLLHEAGHEVFSKLPEGIQTAIHKGIENLTDAKLQVDTERLSQKIATIQLMRPHRRSGSFSPWHRSWPMPALMHRKPRGSHSGCSTS